MADSITPEDIKWLKVVREREDSGRLGRPIPMVVQSRLRSLRLIDLRRGKLVVTSRGLDVLKFGA